MNRSNKQSVKTSNSDQKDDSDQILFSTAEEKILITILDTDKNGISATNLAKVAGVSSRRITQVRKRLKNLKLIEYKTKGRRTRYYTTELTQKLLSLESLIYSTELFKKLNPADTGLIFSQYYDTKFHKSNVLEKLLFNFSLMVGLYVLYISIQLMNPSLVEIILKSKTLDDQSSKSFQKNLEPIVNSSRIKNYLINKWLLNSIQPSKIFELLRSWLYLRRYDFPNVTTKKRQKYTSFELSEINFEDLIQTFERLFPAIFTALEEISKNFEDTYNYWDEGIKRARCKHDYNITYARDRINYECKNCSKISRFLKKNKVRSKKIIGLLNLQVKNTRCMNNHDWFLYNLKHDITYEYFCPLCNRVAYIDAYDREKLDIIKEEILDIGVQFLPLLEEIEYFFHSNPNSYQTVSDFIQYYRSHGKEYVEENEIGEKCKEIFKILMKKKFIKSIQKPLEKNMNRKEVSYIRKSKIRFYKKGSSSNIRSFVLF